MADHFAILDMYKALPWTVMYSFSEAITHRQQSEILLTMMQSYLPLGEGFGFNGNILETNILNLGVVLGIVVSLGGDALRSLLENRKQTISKNLEQAEKRAQEAKERLTQAKFQLETAQKKAVDIQKQGKISAKKERKDSVKRKREEIYRLTEKKEETLRVEEQKAVSQVYRQLVDRVMNKVKQRLATQLDDASHASVINFQIVLLSKYNRIT